MAQKITFSLFRYSRNSIPSAGSTSKDWVDKNSTWAADLGNNKTYFRIVALNPTDYIKTQGTYSSLCPQGANNVEKSDVIKIQSTFQATPQFGSTENGGTLPFTITVKYKCVP